MRCQPHNHENCQADVCRRKRESQRSTSGYDAMSGPLSPVHQAVYGGSFYGSGSTSTDSSSSCDTSSSSGSSHGSGSSSSSCDSGGSY